MKIIKEKTKYHKYALDTKYDTDVVAYCQYLKETFGWTEFNWDHENKKWRFSDPLMINMFKRKFSQTNIESVSQDILEYDRRIEDDKIKAVNAERIRAATVTNFSPTGIIGDLYMYQNIGAEFLLNSGGRALLADAPGVGKTVQAISFVTHSGFKRTIVVCPASVKFSWESEVEKWTNLKSFIVGPKTKIDDIPFDAHFIIVNFDILKKFHNEFKKYNWDCMIVDECHLIKTPSAIRSKVVKSLSVDIPNIIMLTGTPVLSRPVEMFNMLSIIDPVVWNNYYSFAIKYCGGKQGHWGFEAKGATNLSELSEKIGKYFLRRTKEEVLKELPKKNRIPVIIDLPKDIRKEYELAEEDLEKYYLTYKPEKSEEEIEKSLSAEKLVKLNILREINTRGKSKTAIELIESIIDAGEKVIVFSGFKKPLRELHEKYKKNSVMILGDTDIDKRGEIVKKFQEDPKTNIFFGGMKSSGVGITLTAASNIIFIDLPWTPGDLEQAENRAHRPGAVYQSLNIYQINSRDSIDDFMGSLLKRKQEIIDKLIEGKEEKDDSNTLISNYLNSLLKKYDK